MFALANPKRFLDASAPLLPWLAGAAALALGAGLVLGLRSPPDYQQGDTVKIMFLHVPAAWTAMMAYGLLALCSFFSLVWRHPLAAVAAKAAAPLGAMFTLLGLVTGALWGRPMWGAWWVWDGRLTSFLLLLFLNLGYIALWNAIEDETRAARAAAILALLGAVNLPVIEFSVDWWTTLHQGESILRSGGPLIAPVFLWPLGLMALGYTLLFLTLWTVRIRTEILERRVRALLLAGAA
ncbi:MAG TPA: heme ABC transporter permease CcmC [Rhizomicrobium sp.]|jgi:heme exporter protein C|nr:heme ABC transporter permease CcmC [Rhizomicrobium sp.]